MMWKGLLVFWLTMGLPMLSMAAPRLQTLMPPRIHYQPESLLLYAGQENVLGAAFVRQSSEGPGQIFNLVHKNNLWSQPASSFALPNGNLLFLHDVQRLSGGIPVMLFSWDKTDYIRLFNITIDPSNPPPPNTPFPYPQEELQRLMDQNRQLFYSLYVNGSWSAPIPISGTYRPIKAALSTGPDNSAVLVFLRDEDGNEDTSADSELYALIYLANHWSTPVRITHNSQLEQHFQATYANGRYLMVWSVDQDNDFNTQADKRIYFAAVSPEGSLTTAATPVIPLLTDRLAPGFTLGSWRGDGVLLWTAGEAAAGSSGRPVWQSRFNGSWSAPVDTGVKTGLLTQGVLFERNNNQLFVFRDGGVLRTAVYNGETWLGGNILYDLTETGIDFSEIGFLYDGSESLTLGMLGHVPSGNMTAEPAPNEPDGLFHIRLVLRPDLAVTSIQSTPTVKKLGGEVQIDAQVANEGVFPSGAFTANFKKGDEILRTISGESLDPGQNRTISTTITLNSVSLPLEVEIVSSVQELKTENNRMGHLIQVRPDYSVREVKKKDETTLVAMIDETKGVATAAVSVVFYLAQEEAEPVLLAEKTFDPNIALPVEVTWEAMRNRQESFRIEVKVNHERKVTEDDYANNIGSYTFNPLPDLIVSDVSIQDDLMQLKIVNQGDKPVERVDLLITDDPQTASQTELSSENPPAYFEGVVMGYLNEKQVSLHLSERGLSGDHVYAVINPFGAVAESNRNNNLVRTRRANTAFKKAALKLVNVQPGCDAAQVSVANDGEAPAITSRVELMNNQRLVLADRVLSGISPGESRAAQFEALTAGEYTLKLIDPVSKWDVPEVTVQIGVPQEEVCDGVDNDCDGETDEGLVNCRVLVKQGEEGGTGPEEVVGSGPGPSGEGGTEPGTGPAVAGTGDGAGGGSGPGSDGGLGGDVTPIGGNPAPKGPQGFGLGGKCSLTPHAEPSSYRVDAAVLAVLLFILMAVRFYLVKPGRRL